MSTTTPAPSTSSSRTLIIVLAAGALVSVCLLTTCAGVGGWWIVGGAGKASIEGTWVRAETKAIGQHPWKTIEFKANGVYVANGEITGKYSVRGNVVTFETGLGNMVGEVEGANLVIQRTVFSRQ